MTLHTDPALAHQKMMERSQAALDQANKTLYWSKKHSSDQHEVGCHCEVCDWVDAYESEHGITEPAPKCHCVDHCIC